MPTPASKPVDLIDALLALATQARLDCRPLPVIEMDFRSARQFAELVAQSIGCHLYDLQPNDRPDGCVAMFDGVKIVARRPQVCKHEVDGWREHFGPLAEIWS